MAGWGALGKSLFLPEFFSYCPSKDSQNVPLPLLWKERIKSSGTNANSFLETQCIKSLSAINTLAQISSPESQGS